MSSEWELDDGIKSIKSAWRREHTARANLEKMLEQAEAENAKLRELLLDYDKMLAIAADELGYQSRGLRMDSVLNALRIRMYELGIEVDG